jgi:hypothetical protein
VVRWSLSFLLSHQYNICIPLLPHSCYMPGPSQPSWLTFVTGLFFTVRSC